MMGPAVLVASLLICVVEGANILVMLPLPLYSHTVAYMPLMKELAKRGHHITMVSPYPQEKPIPNWKDIEIPKLYEEITDPSMYVLKKGVLDDLKIFWDFGLRGSEAALKQEAVRKVISSPSISFDLVITETFFLLEPMAALGYKFKCPVVTVHPWSMTFTAAHYTGNHYPSSYLPSIFTTYSDNMSFLQRTRNALINTLELIGVHMYYLPQQDKIMRKYFDGLEGFENLPYISELISNTSLTLIDTHHALDFQKPYFRNVIEIGGLTVLNKQAVSKDLQKYLDESTNGFIYFSIGSHLPSSLLPEDFKETLFQVFGKLKENVIMKWDEVDTSNKPKNVRIEKWLPQVEILGHQKCKLFITHGGLHAIQEATYHGVPLVGIPLLADQPINMKLVEQIGLGIKLDVFNITEDTLHKAITAVLTEKKYKNTALERSALLRDNPIGILENAVYHVEYILRHQGAPHMRPPTLHLAWYQLLPVDVAMLLISAVLLSTFTIAALLRIIMLIFGSTKKKHKDKKH